MLLSLLYPDPSRPSPFRSELSIFPNCRQQIFHRQFQSELRRANIELFWRFLFFSIKTISEESLKKQEISFNSYEWNSRFTDG